MSNTSEKHDGSTFLRDKFIDSPPPTIDMNQQATRRTVNLNENTPVEIIFDDNVEHPTAIATNKDSLTIKQEPALCIGWFIRKKGAPVLRFDMPCGEIVEYKKWGDVPDGDIPCPCGDPNHFLIKYGD